MRPFRPKVELPAASSYADFNHSSLIFEPWDKKTSAESSIMVETYAERLAAAMKHAGLKTQKLADQLGITYQAVKKALDGKTRSLSAENNSRVAAMTNISAHWLATGEGEMLPIGGEIEPSNVSPARLRARVPIINWVQAGNWAEIEPTFCLDEAENWHDVYDGRPSRHAFALVVEGDSMTSPYPGDRSFPPGTVIVVDPERGASAGDYVVAKDVSTQKATFKRLATDSGRWFLKPLNPTYPTIEIDDPAIRVIGRVIEFSISGVL